MSVNSSGSVERFTLASGETKSFKNIDLGANQVAVDVHGEVVPNMDGTLPASVAAAVALKTSKDGTTYADVDTGSVVSGGSDILAGVIPGPYCDIVNTGPGVVHVVAKFQRRVNPKTSL